LEYFENNSVVNKDLTLKAQGQGQGLYPKDDFNRILTPQYNLSVESNQNVESKRKSVESKN